VIGGKELASKEGTTQGDPIAMAIYAMGSAPLLNKLKTNSIGSTQIAYADDLTSAGKIQGLRQWWDQVVIEGPKYGYYPEPSKTWLIVKEEEHEGALRIFQGTNVKITTAGKRHLGAPLGSMEFHSQYCSELANEWVSQIKTLSEIAKSEPQAAYACFIHGLRHKYSYFLRTIPRFKDELPPVEQAIRDHLIPALTEGVLISDEDRDLLALPLKYGGLGLINVMDIADSEFTYSCMLTEELTKSVISQGETVQDPEKDKQAKSNVSKLKRENNKAKLEEIRHAMTSKQKRLNDINQQTCASAWLSALPIADQNMILTKREFWDALKIRYGWPLSRLASICACGKPNDEIHALSCMTGGFVTLRHNEVRNLTKDLLAEVCKDVELEPALEPMTGERFFGSTNDSLNARLDVAARGLYNSYQKAFVDVRVFNPMAKRYENMTTTQAMRTNEQEKKNKYMQRVLETENGTFIPVVFSANGGMARECTAFYNRISLLISEKRNTAYSTTVSWVRTRLSFALIRSLGYCLRGSRKWTKKYEITSVADTEIESAARQARIDDPNN
jgi:hypothetical protein